MSSYTLGQMLRYRFDNFMARGGRSSFICLVVIYISILFTLSSIRGVMLLTVPRDGLEPGVYTERGGGYLRHVYITFLQMTDPGNMNQDVMSRPYFKITSVLAGLSGVIMLASLVALVTTGLHGKLADLKKGHSKVVEEGHTLILGWSERVLEILRELIMANESEDDACVVILAETDKEEMDDFLDVRLRDTQTTRVVTRSGSVSSLVNLHIASVATCKSVVVLASAGVSASDEEKADSDTLVIKTILGVLACRPPGRKLHIVAELFFPWNRAIVYDLAPGEIATVNANQVLAKILVQTSRCVGLSVVYDEILSFDGAEMYFYNANWGETTFGELAFHFPDGVPVGIRHADGRLALNPPADTPVTGEDDLLMLATDDSTIEYRTQPVAAPRTLVPVDRRQVRTTERTLIIGWSPKLEIMLDQYSDYVLPGSRVDIMLKAPSDAIREEIVHLDEHLLHVDVRLIQQNPLQKTGLLAVEPHTYDVIVILSQGERAGHPERTDSETIVILLQLRKILAERPGGAPRTILVTEVLVSENQLLVAQTGVHDFIISNRIVSRLLAQMSEDRDIKRVYDILFEKRGAEIYLKPASLYLDEFPAHVTFADLVRLTQKRGEVCLGVKLKVFEGNLERNYGVKLIPEKTTHYALGPEDELVVLAEDET